MLKNTIVRITGLVTAVFVAMVVSAQSALARILVDPGSEDGIAAAAPSSGFEVLDQSWLVPLAIVVAGIAIVAVVVIATRRHHRVATA